MVRPNLTPEERRALQRGHMRSDARALRNPPQSLQDWFPADKPAPVEHEPLKTSLGDKLRDMPSGAFVRVNPPRPVLVAAAAAAAARPEERPEQVSQEKPKQKRVHRKERVFLEPHQRREAIIDLHTMGRTPAADKWNITASALDNWIEATKAVAAGDVSKIGSHNKAAILGVTTAGSSPQTAQQLLDECRRAVIKIGARPEPSPVAPPAPQAPIAESRSAKYEQLQAVIETKPARAPAPVDAVFDRDLKMLEMKTRIAGLEAEINRLTMELHRSEKRCTKLRDVVNSLTEKE